MKITGILLLTALLQMSAAGVSQSKGIDLKMENAPLEEFLLAIEDQTDYRFVYQNEAIKDKQVTVKARRGSVEKLLDNSFSEAGLNYEILNNLVVIKPDEAAREMRQMMISGTVTDENGETLPGVSILIKGTTRGTITNLQGEYTIEVADPSDVLVFSYVGYITQEIAVENQREINVNLQADVLGLEEVVVVGYGTQRKETITGSVSAVETQALIQSPQANISNALVGRMTGLLSVNRDGDPGNDDATLRIRGIGTFAGSADPLIMVDGVEALNFNNLDPNEIESISILKDASATAVYGVRGANGVILITTKKGERGRPVLNLTFNQGISTFTDIDQYLQSYEWAKNINLGYRWNSYITGTYNQFVSDEELEHYRLKDEPILYPSTNWVDLMLKDYSSRTQANLNVSGGTDLIRYFVSLGFLNQEGLFNEDLTDEFDAQIRYKRYNIRSNFDFDITSRFSANVQLSSQLDVESGPDVRPSYLIDLLFMAPPRLGPGIVDGKVVTSWEAFGGNPLSDLLGNGYRSELKNYLTSTVRLNYELDFITEGLSTHGTISYWNLMRNSKSYDKDVVIYNPVEAVDGSVLLVPQDNEEPFRYGEGTGKNRKTYIEAGFDYERTFGSHSFGGLLIYNQSKLYDPGLDFVIPRGYQGLVGRVTYDYGRRYMAEFNMGYNGTENFAVGNRFGFFPAYSLGWVISEEPIFPANNILTYLKVRGSYGEVGNDQIGGQRFLYRPQSYFYSDILGGWWYRIRSFCFGEIGSTHQRYLASYQGDLGNPDLTWERAKKKNIGIDFNLWGNRIRIITDWFEERRDNILAQPRTTPILAGIDFPPQNWGKMKNSGYEFEVNFNHRIGDFNYWMKNTFTYAHNEILFMDEVETPYKYKNRTGQSDGQMFGFIHQGFYNTWEEVNDAYRPRSSYINNKIMPGDSKFKDINGDGVIDSDDRVPIGYPWFPEIQYGISFGGEYRGFDFSVLFQGAENVSRYSYITSVRPFENDLSAKSYIPEMAWTQEKYENGEEIKLPHLSANMVQGHSFQGSTMMVMDASYLRLKNAEIGYSFSSNLLQRIQVSSMRIYCNGYNLLTWDGMYPGDDPEQRASTGSYSPYPNTRTVNFGINVQF